MSLFSTTGIPLQTRNSLKAPIELTILPTLEDTFSPTDDKPRTESKEQETAEGHKRKAKPEEKDEYSSHETPRVKNHDRPSESGTESKSQPQGMKAHHEIKPPGIRWNIAHVLGSGNKDDRRIRFKKKKKSGSRVADEEQGEDEDPEEKNESGSPITIAAICTGMLVLLYCVWTGLGRFWYVVIDFAFFIDNPYHQVLTPVIVGKSQILSQYTNYMPFFTTRYHCCRWYFVVFSYVLLKKLRFVKGF